MIPNKVPIHEDELWYGWILRLSRANALSPEIVYNEFMTGRHSYGKRKRRVPLSYPMGVCRSDDPLIEMDDIALFLKRHTIYGVMNMMRNAGKGAAVIHSILWDDDDDMTLPIRYNDVQSLYFCPQCYMEDIETGRQPYYRTWHHFPGCSVCPIHNKRLIKVTHTIDNDELLDDAGLQKHLNGLKNAPASVGQALTASRYMYAIYKDTVYVSLKELSSVLGHSFGREPSSDQVLSYMLRTMPAEELHAELHAVEADLLSSVRDAFPDTLEIMSKVDIVTKVRCRTCGAVFCDAPGALLRGCGCPRCNETIANENIIARQLKLVGDGEYYLTEPFHGYTNTAKILHATCGMVSSMRLSDRIWMGVECQCAYRTSVEEIQREIDPDGTQYKVISYAGGRKDKQRVRILHTKCQREFDVLFDKFKKSPYCRCCIPSRWNTEVFQEQLDLRKEGYVVVSEYIGQKEPVKARHLVCGTVTEWLPQQWLGGCGCRLCQLNYNYEVVRSAVEQHANEPNITVLPERGGVRLIFDESRSLWEPYKYVMQELARPGKSELFPNRKERLHEGVSDKARVYMDIKGAESREGYWKIAEHPVDISYVRVKQIVRLLLKLGYIEKIKPGYYKTRKNSIDTNIF